MNAPINCKCATCRNNWTVALYTDRLRLFCKECALRILSNRK